MQKNSTLDSCLVLRLLEPQDKSSRMAERITLRGWCLLPADGANACRGEEQLPQIKVIIEEHGGKRTEQSAGLLFFGAEVPLEAAPGCAYLEDFRLTPSERSVVLSAGTLPGVVVDVFGSINISALIPKANECARLFSLALAAEHGGKVSLSNPAVISVFARESWDAPRGGFMSPSHNGDIYSDMIVFDGWAVCPGDAVARVDLLLGKIPCGEASRGISSPLQFGALPDIKEACSCRFSKLVRRSDLSREVLARQELIGTLSV
ncbi:MAG TPA: hypothetical protein PLP17_10630, partial [Oligoflexia bacterium]|nr:hypothetical protein [Oligoflexia bacterium]